MGPPSAVVEGLGDKTLARDTAIAAGLPVIPGYVTMSRVRSRVRSRVWSRVRSRVWSWYVICFAGYATCFVMVLYVPCLFQNR